MKGRTRRRTSMTIGEVLAVLRPDFPDVTISKIRFLEAQGLVAPERTPSGYRKFGDADVERLRFVLTAQRDRYLPLKVIRSELQALERGRRPPAAAAVPTADRAELAAATGAPVDLLDQLVELGLLEPEGGGRSPDEVELVGLVLDLVRSGLDPCQLRTVHGAAEREVALVEQVVAPRLRRRDPDSRRRAQLRAAAVAELTVRLHALLVRRGLRTVLDAAPD